MVIFHKWCIDSYREDTPSTYKGWGSECVFLSFFILSYHYTHIFHPNATVPPDLYYATLSISSGNLCRCGPPHTHNSPTAGVQWMGQPMFWTVLGPKPDPGVCSGLFSRVLRSVMCNWLLLASKLDSRLVSEFQTEFQWVWLQGGQIGLACTLNTYTKLDSSLN